MSRKGPTVVGRAPDVLLSLKLTICSYLPFTVFDFFTPALFEAHCFALSSFSDKPH